MNVQEIFVAAETAAVSASIAYDATLPPETARGLDCGFAWVVVRPARGPFVNWCKANGKGRTGHGGGWHFWNPGKHPTQSIDTKQAGARAFAHVLAAHGIVAEVGSRLD